MCINLPVPSAITDEYHSKVLELPQLLQCIVAYLQHAMPCVSGETLHLGVFIVDFHSGLVAVQNRRQKVFSRGALQFCRGLDIMKLTKTPLIYSVSRFNLGGRSFV